VRVREDLVKFLDSCINDTDLRSRTEVVQDALSLWQVLETRDDGR
jgi:Arc/MetJ-type ribon-helix-helix transcriptional regulator